MGILLGFSWLWMILVASFYERDNIVSYKCDKSRVIGYVNTDALFAAKISLLQ
jgi:hypothetical protein